MKKFKICLNEGNILNICTIEENMYEYAESPLYQRKYFRYSLYLRKSNHIFLIQENLFLIFFDEVNLNRCCKNILCSLNTKKDFLK